MKLCAIIPCYNHHKVLQSICERLTNIGLGVIIIDDASQPETQKVIKELSQINGISSVRHESNQGKGGAVMTGMKEASAQGYTHVLQVDADGQHNLDDAERIIAQARQYPDAVISGQPVYDESIPASRKYGRYITHFWVWIETLSFSIKDTMCGFRVYPLQTTLPLIEQRSLGKRMDFDIEILVRLYWRKVQTRFVATRVIYPEDGQSHFQPLSDNVRISWLHTRLFFGMLIRMPVLLYRKLIA